MARTMERTGKRRLRSYPLTGTDETDFTTANDFVPFSVPLEKVSLGSWKYVATELGDIEFLYELESSDLLIQTNVCGTNGGESGIFRISQVSAADLSLVSVIPGSLESMVARLILETEKDILFEPAVPLEMSMDRSDNDKVDGSQFAVSHCRIVTITASVHESGHLRDLLLFLKSNYASKAFGPDSVFLSPQRVMSTKEESPATPSAGQGDEQKKTAPQVTFLEGLPFWVSYIPWQLYTKRARILIQWVVLLYSIFSVIWACWQLYRHSHVIRFVVAPILELIKPYLFFLFDWFDYLFALFTEAWQKFLSPLNILRGIMITPLLGALVQLRQVFSPIVTALVQCLASSGVVSALKSLSLVVWSFLGIIRKPFSAVWSGILNSRIAVASLDLPRLQLKWVWSLIMNSFKAIGFGMARLLGYTRREHKKRKALHELASQSYDSPDGSVRMRSPSLTPGQRYRQRMPIYYSSPLSKNN